MTTTAGAAQIQSQEPGALLGPHVGAESQGFMPSSTAFPGHKQGAGWEARLPTLEPSFTWDLSMFKAKTLATRLSHWATGNIFKTAT